MLLYIISWTTRKWVLKKHGILCNIEEIVMEIGWIKLVMEIGWIKLGYIWIGGMWWNEMEWSSK